MNHADEAHATADCSTRQAWPTVLRLAKHMVNRAATSDLATALDLEAYSQGLALAGDDHQEGLAAFFDKRTPRFTGR